MKVEGAIKGWKAGDYKAFGDGVGRACKDLFVGEPMFPHQYALRGDVKEGLFDKFILQICDPKLPRTGSVC